MGIKRHLPWLLLPWLLCWLLTGFVCAQELQSNNARHDSAKAIEEHIREAKPLPAGVFYVHRTLDTGAGVGGALLGSGRTDQARADGAWRDQPVTVIIDARPKDNTEPLIRVRRSAFRIHDIGLVGCVVPSKQHNTSKGAGPLIEITQIGAEWPVGQTDITRVTLANSEIGILHADAGNGVGHSDHTRAQITTSTVDYPVIIDENQSVDHHFDIFARGNGKAVIWAKQGGKVTCRLHTNGSWDRWLLLGDGKNKPTKNNGFYRLSVDMDGSDSVGSPVEELTSYEWSRPVVLIDGWASDSAEIKGDPQLLNKAKVRINIERCLKGAYVWEAN